MRNLLVTATPYISEPGECPSSLIYVEPQTFSIIFAYLPVCVAVLRSCLLFGRYEHAQVATTGKESIHRPI